MAPTTSAGGGVDHCRAAPAAGAVVGRVPVGGGGSGGIPRTNVIQFDPAGTAGDFRMISAGTGDVQIPGGIKIVAGGVLGIDTDINLASRDQGSRNGDAARGTDASAVPVAISHLPQVNAPDIDLRPVVTRHADLRGGRCTLGETQGWDECAKTSNCKSQQRDKKFGFSLGHFFPKNFL